LLCIGLMSYYSPYIPSTHSGAYVPKLDSLQDQAPGDVHSHVRTDHEELTASQLRNSSIYIPSGRPLPEWVAESDADKAFEKQCNEDFDTLYCKHHGKMNCVQCKKPLVEEPMAELPMVEQPMAETPKMTLEAETD